MQTKNTCTICLFLVVCHSGKTSFTSASLVSVKYKETHSIQKNAETLTNFYTRSRLHCFNVCSSHNNCNTVSLQWEIIVKKLRCQLMNGDCSTAMSSNMSGPFWINSICNGKTPITEASKETTKDLAATSRTIEKSVTTIPTVEISTAGNHPFLIFENYERKSCRRMRTSLTKTSKQCSILSIWYSTGHKFFVR